MSVDDSAIVRHIVETALLEAGFEVIMAVDGEDAMAKLDEAMVDMVISDLNMPKMNGVELVRNIRAKPGMRFTPIVMLTSESEEEMRQKGKDAGASAWLLKPFKPEQLIRLVKMILP
jgi:two-component system chemotaxis response regulator CheY